MSTVTALVSAYYAEQFIAKRLHNLIALQPTPEIMITCESKSLEEKAIGSYGKHWRDINVFSTYGIPTIYKAWNIGIRHSKGDYLTSANCDDLFYRNGLNVMSAYLDAHPEIDLVYGDCDIRKGSYIFPWKRGESDFEHGTNRIGAMPMWRRSLHDRFGMFDESMVVSGDYDFWMRCYKGGAKFAHIDETVGLYWWRADSLEHRNKALRKREDMQIEGVTV